MEFDRAVNGDRAVGRSKDVASLPDVSHGVSRSGPVRERRPVYVDLLPPCNAGCPARENIQAWLAHTTAGHPEQAWRKTDREQSRSRPPMIRWTDRPDGAQIAAGITRVRAARIGQRPMTTP